MYVLSDEAHKPFFRNLNFHHLSRSSFSEIFPMTHDNCIRKLFSNAIVFNSNVVSIATLYTSISYKTYPFEVNYYFPILNVLIYLFLKQKQAVIAKDENFIMRQAWKKNHWNDSVNRDFTHDVLAFVHFAFVQSMV